MIIIQCTQDNNWKVAYLNTLKLFTLKRWLLRYFVLILLGLLVLGVTHQNERDLFAFIFQIEDTQICHLIKLITQIKAHVLVVNVTY